MMTKPVLRQIVTQLAIELGGEPGINPRAIEYTESIVDELSVLHFVQRITNLAVERPRDTVWFACVLEAIEREERENHHEP